MGFIMKKLLTLLLLLTMLLSVAAPAFAASDKLTHFTMLLSAYTWKLEDYSTSKYFYNVSEVQLPSDNLYLTEDAAGQIYLIHVERGLAGIVTFSADEETMVVLLLSANAYTQSNPLYEVYVYRRQ